MNIGFYGAGCTHIGIECFIAQVNKLLMHIRVQKQWWAETEDLAGVLGWRARYFWTTLPRILVTDCWLKLLWEKCHMFEVLVDCRLCRRSFGAVMRKRLVAIEAV